MVPGHRPVVPQRVYGCYHVSYRENDIITDYDSDELRNLFDGQTEKDVDE